MKISASCFDDISDQDLSTLVLENKHEYDYKDPWWRDQVGEIKWGSAATKAALYHQKGVDESATGPSQTIADAENLTLQLVKNKDKISLIFHFKQADINLPHDFHLAGAINEMIKQEEHVTKWFKKEYLIAKRKFNFQFRNWKMK